MARKVVSQVGCGGRCFAVRWAVSWAVRWWVVVVVVPVGGAGGMMDMDAWGVAWLDCLRSRKRPPQAVLLVAGRVDRDFFDCERCGSSLKGELL